MESLRAKMKTTQHLKVKENRLQPKNRVKLIMTKQTIILKDTTQFGDSTAVATTLETVKVCFLNKSSQWDQDEKNLGEMYKMVQQWFSGPAEVSEVSDRVKPQTWWEQRSSWSIKISHSLSSSQERRRWAARWWSPQLLAQRATLCKPATWSRPKTRLAKLLTTSFPHLVLSQVVKLKSLLSTKREQIATLRTVLKVNILHPSAHPIWPNLKNKIFFCSGQQANSWGGPRKSEV